ncbi:gas vesicle protein GvpO [Salinigranum sp.]|uniref:gas vesicle protein GvpO n=1 Tax=Salinigranum sp. TaxID=1966351 RepID=UPI003568162A
MAAASNESRCRARVDDGDRCERRARNDGFCRRHGPSDPTVDACDTERQSDRPTSFGDVRAAVVDSATSLVGHPLDDVVAITRRGDGWTATVEVIERTPVSDAPDVRSRYELLLDDAPVVTEYRRLGRVRRRDSGRRDRR